MNEETTYAEIGRRQAEARKLLGLTQAEMAARIGVPMRTLSDNERGISVAGGRVLAAYCTLGIRSDWLLTGHGKPFSNQTPQHIQDMIEVADEGLIALAHFETSDIRESYLVPSDERRRQSRLSLSREYCESLCAAGELGLPNALRLFTVGQHPFELLIVDGTATGVRSDGDYVVVSDGVLQKRRVQVMRDRQAAVMCHGDTSRIAYITDTEAMITIGAVVGMLIWESNSQEYPEK